MATDDRDDLVANVTQHFTNFAQLRVQLLNATSADDALIFLDTTVDGRLISSVYPPQPFMLWPRVAGHPSNQTYIGDFDEGQRANLFLFAAGKITGDCTECLRPRCVHQMSLLLQFASDCRDDIDLLIDDLGWLKRIPEQVRAQMLASRIARHLDRAGQALVAPQVPLRPLLHFSPGRTKQSSVLMLYELGWTPTGRRSRKPALRSMSDVLNILRPGEDRLPGIVDHEFAKFIRCDQSFWMDLLVHAEQTQYEITLNSPHGDRLLKAMVARGMLMAQPADPQPLTLASDPPQFVWCRNPVGWQYAPIEQDDCTYLFAETPWLIQARKGTITPLETAVPRDLWPLLGEEPLAKASIDQIFASLPPAHVERMQSHAPVERTEDLGQLSMQPELHLSLEASHENDSMTAIARIFFRYSGNRLIAPSLKGRVVDAWEGEINRRWSRDVDGEIAALNAARFGRTDVIPVATGLPGQRQLADNCTRFENEFAEPLRTQGWSLLRSADWPGAGALIDRLDIKAERADKRDLTVQMLADVRGHRIDLTALICALLARETAAALAQRVELGHGASLDLPDGDRVTLSAEVLASLLPLLAAITVPAFGPPRLAPAHYALLDAAQSSGAAQITGDQSLKRLWAAFRDVPTDLPEPLRSQLKLPARPYQIYAANWFALRRAHGFGGMLCDDTAAGKTLMGLLIAGTAALEPAANGRPTLVVVPKTLMSEQRWHSEVRKFLPHLKVGEIARSADATSVLNQDDLDLVITTYDALRIAKLKFIAYPWNVVLCDEGHRLANHAAQVTQSVEQLSARQKVVISATPNPNQPSQRWSLMNLCVPGLLRDRAWFDRTFPKLRRDLAAAPSESQLTPAPSNARFVLLGKLTAPFILRRTNDELGNQLPDVNEVVHRIELASEQARDYEFLRAAASKKVTELLSANQFANRKIELRVVFLRMRQAVCDLGLVNPAKVSARSSKTEVCLDLVEDFLAEGRRVLIGSDFSAYLRVLADHLAKRNLLHHIVTGEATASKRRSAFSQYRQGSPSALLVNTSMSEGFEVPETDVVISLNPWWNKERDKQLLGRARRDDRKKSITFVRLLAADTVEEIIDELGSGKLAVNQAMDRGHASDEVDTFSLEEVQMLLAASPKGFDPTENDVE
jgi:superfamily II DNA or RNA helicase